MAHTSSAPRLAIPPLLALLSITACCDTTAPDEAEPKARYAIASVDGDALPIAVAGSLFTTTFLTAGTIEFRTRDRLRDDRTFQVRENATGEPLGNDTEADEAPSYRLEGSRLIVNRTYGATVYSDTGQLLGDSVIVLRVKALNTTGPVAPPGGAGPEVRARLVEAP